MNSSESPFGRPSPRRELQGPRPTPLKVNKESYKIKKPPAAPAPQPTDTCAQPAQARPPVIIYTVSPKVIHTNPNDFMSLVQRLTGPGSSPSSAAAAAAAACAAGSASLSSPVALSPAARLALEKPVSSPVGDRSRKTVAAPDVMDQLDIDVRAGIYPGILSPVPSSLPPISPGFFSPSVDPNSLSFLHELSPAFHGNRSYVENTFLASPNNFLSTPTVPSPNAYWDLFNQFHDP